MEPYRKRRWRHSTAPEQIAFFTCARPGRSLGSTQPVPDAIVHKWVNGLPGPRTAIISLLGCKPDGKSEFSFYNFSGKDDTTSESRGKPPWQAWLDRHHPDRGVTVIEHPTTDFQPITDETLQRVAKDVQRLLGEGRTIVLIDSGGQTRTGTVCRHLGLVEDTRT
jgi:hypothetical protein